MSDIAPARSHSLCSIVDSEASEARLASIIGMQGNGPSFGVSCQACAERQTCRTSNLLARSACSYLAKHTNCNIATIPTINAKLLPRSSTPVHVFIATLAEEHFALLHNLALLHLL